LKLEDWYLTHPDLTDENFKALDDQIISNIVNSPSFGIGNGKKTQRGLGEGYGLLILILTKSAHIVIDVRVYGHIVR
jgi:hypothetical protein